VPQAKPRPSTYGWPPRWSYVNNGQPAIAQGMESSLHMRADLVQPSPSSVFLFMEQSTKDGAAMDNTTMLFASVFQEGNDSLSDVHAGVGNMSFFDGHALGMNRKLWIQKMSTPRGVKEFAGGYVGN
jgi:prepilin-type processing-associated H-X9-DG protein